MGQLGTYLLLFGLAVSGYGLLAAAVGAKTGRPALVESARRCAFGLFAIVAAANATMLAALLTNDFAIRYVAGNSAQETPAFFKALSLWAADDGSLLLWNLILAGYIAAVALRFRRDRPPTFPYALGVLFAVQAFYLILISLIPEWMITGIKLNHLWLVGRFFEALPSWVTNGLAVTFYFGGTSLLIVVGVAMDTVTQIEAQLIMRHYDGFTPKSGRLRGRRTW